MAEEIPRLAGDGLACLIIVPLLFFVLDRHTLQVATAAFLVAMLGSFAVRTAMIGLEQRAVEADGKVYRIILGALEGRLEIVARGGEAAYVDSFERRLDEHQQLIRRTGFFGAALGRVPVAAAALVVFIALLLDAHSHQEMQVSVVGPVLVLGAAFPTLRGAALGVVGFVRTPVLVRGFVELLEAPRRAELSSVRTGGAPRLPATVVHFEGVSFQYAPSSRRILSELSFAWDTREPLVVLGPNGAGKSTVLRLLLALRAPTRGSIRFDETDLASTDVVALRRQCCLLPQRPYLGEPYTTVRTAMQLASPDASDEAMLMALKAVRMKEALLTESDRPLDWTIGRLSAGQRQRIAFARALLLDASFYLFDEPDADLDRDGAALVAAVIRDLCAEGKMVAVTAHGAELSALASKPIVLVRQLE